MNKFITTILNLSMLTFIISCTDLDEDLRGVITSDISVEGIVTDDGGSGGGDALGGAYAQGEVPPRSIEYTLFQREVEDFFTSKKVRALVLRAKGDGFCSRRY